MSKPQIAFQYYIENKDEIAVPEWNPKPIYFPPTSPKKSSPALKAGAGLERAAMSLKAKKEEREAQEGILVIPSKEKLLTVEMFSLQAVERKLLSPEKKRSHQQKLAVIEGKEHQHHLDT